MKRFRIFALIASVMLKIPLRGVLKENVWSILFRQTKNETPIKAGLRPMRWVLAQAALCVAAATLLRAILAVMFPTESPVPPADYVRAFLVGLHLDIMIAAVLWTPLAIGALFIPESAWQRRAIRVPLHGICVIGWSLFSFLLIAEWFFFDEFRSRFNPVAIDYLLYPHEVFINVWQSYPLVWVICLCLLIGVTLSWTAWRLGNPASCAAKPARGWKPALLWLSATLLLMYSVRLNELRFSRERAINELANNTFLCLATAGWTRNLDYAHFYKTMPHDEALARVRRLLGTPEARFVPDPESIQREIAGDTSRPKLNLVLLVEESLGSEFFGCLGRPAPTLMPRMDAIATNEAILFDNIYADGNRTIRGYEGVFSSFPPLPGDSIVARDKSENVETIARVLARDGYDTTFIYAGRGIFDGTGPFAKANGWSNFVELKDFERPTFTTAWGVCNEDLYDRLIRECRARHVSGKPFFMTTMSVSNHRPFSYPAGRIPEDPKAKRRQHAVKYTDYALGRFFDTVRQEPFWTNTIFAVVGDHGARVYGSQTIPIRSYEVPLIVVGPAVVQRPQRVSILGCQLDVAPTLLGLIGRPYDSAFFGHDLLKNPDVPSRCLLHHNRSIGIYSDRRLVVFSLNKKVEYYTGNPKTEQLQRISEPDSAMLELEKDAIALFQTADELYVNRRFRIQPPENSRLSQIKPVRQKNQAGDSPN